MRDETKDPTAWGQPISGERQGELQARLDAWGAPGAEHGKRQGRSTKSA